MAAPPRTLAFDAYGTVFDVHTPVRALADRVGPDAAAISALWRQKQLEYTWVLSLMGDYRDFWTVTQDALDVALATFGVADTALRASLLGAYRNLDAHPDARRALADLHSRGERTAILSNATREMLDQAMRSAGIASKVDVVISADDVGVFKTDARVYAHAVEVLGGVAANVTLHSSNAWDVAGAMRAGLEVVWVNRTGQPDEYGLRGRALEVRDLSGYSPT
ncbi:MAG: haloacid dehalogenase type II [Actinobacteria bacterium]|nr:haloacid dehalogenase type II [Actinomycetota bacterium]